MSEEDAFKNTVECITGPITKTISTKGIKAVYDMVPDKKEFMKAPCVVHALQGHPVRVLRRGAEHQRDQIRLAMAAKRFDTFPMGKVGTSAMWKVGEKVRDARVEEDIPVNSFTAGASTARA